MSLLCIPDAAIAEEQARLTKGVGLGMGAIQLHSVDSTLSDVAKWGTRSCIAGRPLVHVQQIVWANTNEVKLMARLFRNGGEDDNARWERLQCTALC